MVGLQAAPSLLAVAATHLPLRPVQKGWMEIVAGLTVAGIFAGQIWWAFKPGGSYTIGRLRTVEVTRAQIYSFWGITVLYGAFCAAGAITTILGAVTVFLWMTG